MPDSPSEVLRAAARHIRQLAEKATRGPWEFRTNTWAEHLRDYNAPSNEIQGDIKENGVGRAATTVAWGYDCDDDNGSHPAVPHDNAAWLTSGDARWIAAFSPAIAEPLAMLFESEADCLDSLKDVQVAVPKILDGIAGEPTEATMTVTIDTSPAALALARLVLSTVPKET